MLTIITSLNGSVSNYMARKDNDGGGELPKIDISTHT